jgi:hypothetical protein
MDGPHIDQPAMSASHGLVFDSAAGPPPLPAGAHSHAMVDTRTQPAAGETTASCSR